MKQSRLRQSLSFLAWLTLLCSLQGLADAAEPAPMPMTEKEIFRILSAGPSSYLKRGLEKIDDDPGEYSLRLPASSYIELQALPKTATLINFASNSARLPKDAHAILNEYAKALKGGLRDAVLVIVGHTDNVGSEPYNLNLARRRAQAVKDYLVGQGIGQDRLTVKAFGAAYPVASNETEEGRRLNRRCEFIRVDSLQAALRVK